MKRVLLADDDPALRSALALLLETRLGLMVVAEAGTMEALLNGLVAARPEVVVLDWELPGEPRLGRVAALRAVSADVKVIVTSARPEAAAQAAAAQIDAFVCKTDPPEGFLGLF